MYVIFIFFPLSKSLLSRRVREVLTHPRPLLLEGSYPLYLCNAFPLYQEGIKGCVFLFLYTLLAFSSLFMTLP
ncbi:MAG: hypothetical protein A3I04_07205 [Nitrospinae bacterium RIFCSPLOWO2_02_FULL_39_110]|nr:MAG: hypothetical protein A3I04_07205 [Nitrospinae bacterium RIFCSPLOWO2_02_FULL_39_110]OGW10289.1 MAG: hypothetical protein A3F81_07135 [Nitrospinae bacterium RIFCSPLOWO2_12_FULL_39_93]